MSDPAWLVWGFAAVMAAVAVYCVGRLALARRLGRRNHVDITVTHILMGTAMAGMLEPRWTVLPTGVWEVVFAVVGAYFLVTMGRFALARGVAGRDEAHVHHVSHHLIHALMAGGMLYMYWLGTGPLAAGGRVMSMSAAGGVGIPGDPSLTLFIVAVLLASAVWQLDAGGRTRVVVAVASPATGAASAAAVGGADLRPWLAPRLEVGCHVAMCVTMAFMLVLVI